MAVTTWTLTGTLVDIIGVGVHPTATSARLETSSQGIHDPGVSTHLGPRYPININEDGTFTVSGIPDTTATNWQYRVVITYLADDAGVQTYASPWFPLTQDRRLDQAVNDLPPTLPETASQVFGAWGTIPVIRINPSTGVWPSRTVPAGYTGEVQWDSIAYAGTPVDPPAAVDGDRWMRRKG